HQKICKIDQVTPFGLFLDLKSVQHGFCKGLFHGFPLQGIVRQGPELHIGLYQQQFVPRLFEMDQLFIAQLSSVQADIIAADTAAQGIHVEEIPLQVVHLQVDLVRIIVKVKIEIPAEFLKVLGLFKGLGKEGDADKIKEVR